LKPGNTNGVTDLRWIDESELNQLEPNVAGMGALLSPSTGIIDSHQYMLSLQGILESNSGLIAFDTYVKHIEEKRGDSKFTRVYTDKMTLDAKWVINAGGLHAPNLASEMEGVPEAKYAIGHYYSYSGAQPFSHLIYPTPEDGDLGVRVTLDMGGQIKFGPAVRWINSIDYQFDDSRREAFVEAIRSYFPGLEEVRLQPSYTGIGPKISGPGEVADLLFHTPVDHVVFGRINLLGIESPGLTSSLAIAEAVSEVFLGEI
jgi:L-2-hydroxyglutarate oxidase LhgO